MKKVYFLSDAHLGSWAIGRWRENERRLVAFLESIRHEASAIYILGDLFDFWHEYRYVVPKGYTRLLGKLGELCDQGVEVHVFTGNHDLWCGDYLEKECGVTLHREALTVKLQGLNLFMAHGDGLDRTDKKYLALRWMFHNRVCQRLFASIHPRWAMWFGYTWAKHSRKKHEQEEGHFEGMEKEGLAVFARHYLKDHPETDAFLFGHYHVEVDEMLSPKTRFIILGEWISTYTYVVLDEGKLTMKNYTE